LALIGVPFLIWNVWTVVAWLAADPHQITRFRGHDDASSYAAHAIEAVLVVLSLWVILYLVRGCRRAGRILTVDVMFCLCGATLFWSDVGDNFFQPVLLFSSKWINVNATCGHMPFVVNSQCGAAPDPIVFNWLAETFGLLAGAVLIGALLNRLRVRRPDLSMRQLFAVVVLAGILLDLLFELPAISLHLWTYTASAGLPLGGGQRYALFEVVEGGLFFALFVWVRYYKNDKGQTLVERGVDSTTSRFQTAISLLALYGFFQAVTWIPGMLPLAAQSFYQSRWPALPAHLVNDVCGNGTPYGPCPGTPHFRMPGRG
jgi:hypothetical protein